MVRSASSIPFDPEVHVTAGQLRRLGFYLSEMVPDRAFVRRIAVAPCRRENLRDESATVGLDVLEPFLLAAA